MVARYRITSAVPPLMWTGRPLSSWNQRRAEGEAQTDLTAGGGEHQELISASCRSSTDRVEVVAEALTFCQTEAGATTRPILHRCSQRGLLPLDHRRFHLQPEQVEECTYLRVFTGAEGRPSAPSLEGKDLKHLNVLEVQKRNNHPGS